MQRNFIAQIQMTERTILAQGFFFVVLVKLLYKFTLSFISCNSPKHPVKFVILITFCGDLSVRRLQQIIIVHIIHAAFFNPFLC